MAIALLGTPTSGGSGAGATGLAVMTVPTAAQGLTDANTLLMLSVCGTATAIADIPAPTTGSWTTWVANTASGTVFKHVTYSRFCSSEPTSYAITGLTTGRYSWDMRVYSGVDGTTPQDVTPTTQTSTTAMPTPAAITPVTTGAWVDCTNSIVTASTITNTTWTSSNMTLDTNATSTAAAATNAAMGQAHVAWTSGSFSPNLTQATSTAARGVTFTSAIRPAAAAATSLPELVMATPRY